LADTTCFFTDRGFPLSSSAKPLTEILDLKTLSWHRIRAAQAFIWLGNTMIPVTDEHEFRQLTSAAAEIFAYRGEDPAVKDGPWGFDRGNVSDDKASAYAQFSCANESGWGKDELTIFAKKQADGRWLVTHEIQRGVR